MSKVAIQAALTASTKNTPETAPLPPDYAPRPAAEIINEATLLQRLPICRRTLATWKTKRQIPYIQVKGSRRVLYFWPDVLASLVRMQRGCQ